MLKNQDQQGLRFLYQRYSSLVYGQIFKIVGESDVAENLLQDTFIKVWQRIETYNQAKGRFISWLLTIARNAALDSNKSKYQKQNTVTVSLKEAVQSPKNKVTEIALDYIGVKETVARLAPKYREIIELTYFSGFTQIEAAEALNLPLGTVKSRVKKAFQELRRLLHE